MHSTFGSFIRFHRQKEKLTLTQLGARLLIDSANLSKIENGKREFDESKLNKLANELGINKEIVFSEYYSEKFAEKIYDSDCCSKILIMTEQKVEYLKSQNNE